ncbi:hypothetical protein [Erwinia mallotivora]|uniref:hypothetical protein n=1 Tax=Erwinia mallotivora TaxID=69222 RepID=UPI0021C07513|nr:hypothetical protein [Erwinia mallotivora]
MQKSDACFFNPGMTPCELEDWLIQQQHAVKCYNNLMRAKAELKARLQEIESQEDEYTKSGFLGRQSFLWVPSPLLKTHQVDKQFSPEDRLN